MDESEVESDVEIEERKISVESKATILFLCFILIEGYLLISGSMGLFPFTFIEDYPYYQIILEFPEALYALYWLGILCLIMGFLLGDYNKIYPPVILIGSIIFFLIFIL